MYGKTDEGNAESGTGSEQVNDLYKECAVNAFRYFGINSFTEFNQMTMREYNILSEAYALKYVDRERDLHELAYLTFSATATKKSGKPVYKTFKKFFDYEKELDRVKRKGFDASQKEKNRISTIGNLLYGGE